jgi:hypothetical protein
MGYMFNGALAFNQDIRQWNVNSVTTNPPSDFSTGSPLSIDNIPDGFEIEAPVIPTTAWPDDWY